MKVIDVIKESATLLGLEEERAILDTMNSSNEVEIMAEYPNIASLFNLLKFSIKELCVNYVPMYATQKVNVSNKKFQFSTLSNIIKIQNIVKDGQYVKYKISNGEVILEEDGEYEVNYLSYPLLESCNDDISFLENLSPDVIIFGLCSYYSLAHGMFEEFENLHDKYIEKAESVKELKIFEIPARRWE